MNLPYYVLVAPSFRLPLLALLLILVTFSAVAQPVPLSSDAATTRFLENRGQVIDTRGELRPDILFTGGGPGLRLYLRRTGISYIFYAIDSSQEMISGRRIDMELIGANPNPVVECVDPSGDYLNFYLPHCADGITGVAKYAMVTYRDVYPAIDLIVRGTASGMKYDFVVHPGGDPSHIRLRYTGADGIEAMADGGVHIYSAIGHLHEGRPYTYQLAGDRGASGSRKVEVISAWQVHGSDVSFAIEDYDHTRPLVIDPTLIWSTYYGGSGNDYGYGWGGAPYCSDVAGGGGWSIGKNIAVDHNHNLTVASGTTSSNFPISPGAFQTAISGNMDVGLVSFNANGTRRWATYIGGIVWDSPSGVAVDSTGSLSVGITTFSPNFPITAGAFQTTFTGITDAVIARFDSTGRRRWATFFGGASYVASVGIAVDRRGNIAITGYVDDGTLPVTANAFQGVWKGEEDAFVLKMDSSGRRLWSTYLGGERQDWGIGVAFDTSGNLVASGETSSPGFPVSNGAYSTLINVNGANVYTYDSYIISFDPAGNRNWATYFGGTRCDLNSGVDVDRAGNIYITGNTGSFDLPVTARAIQPLRKGTTISDGFFSKFTNGGRLIWSTYYGGSDLAMSTSISVAPNGHLYFIGVTSSLDLLKTTNNYQPTFRGLQDANFGEIDSSGVLLWDSYFGGTSYDVGTGIIYDGAGSLFITGNTSSTDLSTRRAYQANLVQGFPVGIISMDMFIARFCTSFDPPVVAKGPTSFCSGDSLSLEAPRGYDRYRWSPTNKTTRSIVVRDSGNYSVFVEDTVGCSGLSPAIHVVVNPLPRPVMSFGNTTICKGDSVIFRINYPGARRYRWTTGDTVDHIVVTTSGTYAVQVTDSNGCVASTQAEQVVVNPLPLRPVISPLDTIRICPDSLAILSIGGAYSTVEWNNGELTPSITVGAGRYWARVSNQQGCFTESDTIVVAPWRIPRSTIQPSGPIAICSGDSVLLDAGVGYANYRWSTGDSTRIVAVRSQGVYRVDIIDTNGCWFTSDSIVVTMHAPVTPSIMALGTTTLCKGDSLLLDGGSGTFARFFWSTGDTTARMVVRSSGVYSLRVTTVDGCSGTDSISVVFNPAPTVTISGPSEVCRNSEATYSVDNHLGSNYLWTVIGGTPMSGMGTSQIMVAWGVNGAGRLQCQERDGITACVGTSAEMSVTIGAQLRPTVTPGGTLSFCPDDSVTLDAGLGYTSYLWNTGATTQRLTVRDPGTYSVSVADASGCSGRSEDVVVVFYSKPNPIIRLLGSATIDEGDSVFLEVDLPYKGYRWSSGDTTRRIAVTTSGDYNVTVTDSNGCTGRSAGSVRITVRRRGGIDSIIVRLEVGSATASPGDRVMIPLRMQSPNFDAANVTAYTGELRYNRMLLVPSGATPTGIVDGTERVIPIGGAIPSNITTGGDLAQFEFIAMLGDAETTPIRLTAFALTGAPVSATIVDGEFRLTGLCHNGGTRLVQTDGSVGLKSVRPNPTSGHCEVEYEVVESGMTRVYLMDLLGRRVAELQRGSIEPGRYLVGFNASMLGSGIYAIVLETPTDRWSLPLQVVR